jgi:hypothetical protein
MAGRQADAAGLACPESSAPISTDGYGTHRIRLAWPAQIAELGLRSGTKHHPYSGGVGWPSSGYD